jgi:hypothetical protein
VKKILAIVLLWIVSGAYGFGTFMAEMDYQDAHDPFGPICTSRKNLGGAVAVALGGPIGAFVAALETSFNEHGFHFWSKKAGNSGGSAVVEHIYSGGTVMGYNNLAKGNHAPYSLTNGSNNVPVPRNQTLYNATTGINNIGVGGMPPDSKAKGGAK